MTRRASLCVSGLMLVCLAARPPVSARAQVALPEAPGGDVARARCLSCHGPALLTSQRLSRGGWDREVAKMERWAGSIAGDDRAQLLDYLSTRFGDGQGGTAVDAAPLRGRGLYERACRGCHGDGLVRAQRLTRAGWVRSVAKMVQWGASVAEADREALVDYLVAASMP